MKRWECTVCGYIHKGEEPPDECPVCLADKSMFVELPEEETPDNTTTEQTVESEQHPAVKPTLLQKTYTFVSKQIIKHHLHPIMVHSPNGILPMALIFLLITVFVGWPLFEIAAFYSLVFVLISMPLVLFTGYEVWQKRYRGAMTSMFRIKISSSIVTVVLLLVLIIWRAIQPDIISTASTGRWIFLFLSFTLVGAVGVAGSIGGKLVFGSRKD
jgi:rubredoxin/uncharacterized membrane protein